ncbi:hypothetical protein FB451DRAFT_1285594, partial [Mycena latifolia]
PPIPPTRNSPEMLLKYPAGSISNCNPSLSSSLPPLRPLPPGPPTPPTRRSPEMLMKSPPGVISTCGPSPLPISRRRVPRTLDWATAPPKEIGMTGILKQEINGHILKRIGRGCASDDPASIPVSSGVESRGVARSATSVSVGAPGRCNTS